MGQSSWVEFSQQVNDARVKRHLSISAVARIAGVPKATAQGWLSGRHSPTPALRDRFLRLLAELDLADQLPEGLWLAEWDAIQPRLREGHAPYVGSRPFGVADVDFYFGRSAETGRLAQAVIDVRQRQGHGIVVVVGPSGSGKSSLVSAGLAGRQARDGALAGVSVGLDPWDCDEAEVVVWDQFEADLFAEEDTRTAAVNRLEALASRGVVVVVLRSDAFAEAQAIPVLAEALSRPFLIAPLTRAELREVITGPAELAGVKVDDELVSALTQELAPGSARDLVGPEALPLLSNALLVTWAAGSGERMTLGDYRKIGGLADAVELLAEQVFAELDSEQQRAAQWLFLRLISLTPHALVRLSAPLSELDPVTLAVTRPFVAARMLTVADGQVRISHEALVRHWQRLEQWVDDHGAELTAHARLRRAAELWRDSDRDPQALVPVEKVTGGVEITDSALLGGLEREFVAASKAHFASALEQERTVSTRLRRQRRTAVALAVVASLTAVGAGVFFFRGEGFRSDAVQARDDAQSRQVALSARLLGEKSPSLLAHLALVSNSISSTLQGRSIVVDATGVDVPLRRLGDADPVMATSPDGQLVVRASGHGKLTWWRGDQLTRSLGTEVVADAAGANLWTVSIAQAAGRDLVAVGGVNVRQLWDFTAEPRLIATLPADAATTAITLSRDGTRLVAGDDAGAVTIYQLDGSATPQPSAKVALDPTAGQPTKVTALALSADGVLYVGGAAGRIDRWRIVRSAVHRLDGIPAAVVGASGSQAVEALSLALRPDGTELAAGVTGQVVLRWRLGAHDKVVALAPLTGFESWVNAVTYSGDGTSLGAASSDQSIDIFDAATGQRTRRLSTASIQTGIGFAANGQLVGVGSDGAMLVWPARSPLLRESGSVAYNLHTDGSHWLGAGTASDGISLWRLGALPQAMPKPVPPALPEGDVQVGAVGVAPTGAYLLGSTLKGRVLSWPLTDQGAGAGAAYDTGLGVSVIFTAISPDSATVAAMSNRAGKVVLFRAGPQGALTKYAEVVAPDPQLAVFSADGTKLLVAQGDKSLVVWSLADTPVKLGSASLSAIPYTLDPAPHSARVAIGSAGGEVSLWDFSDPAKLTQLRSWHDASADVYSVEFSPDETRLIGTSGDDIIWAWDLTSAESTAELAIPSTVGRPWDARYIDATHFAVSGSEGAVRVWDATVADAVSDICARVGDPLTAEEWSHYLPGLPPRKVC
jgi:WD40 repeat protein/transcriptional regulator with XRE-family HTH domain